MAKPQQIVVPSSPEDLKKLFEGINEISNSMTRAESEASYQKESIDELAEKYNLPAKSVRQMAKDYHKDTYDKKVDEFSDYQDLYESVVHAGKKNV